jgi:hypothetical protein
MMRLGQCLVNPNHWYSLHSAICPWCRILNEQGRDHFPSLNNPINLRAVHETAKREFPPPVSQPALPQKPFGTFTDIRLIALLVIGILVIAVILTLPSGHSKPVVPDPVTPQPTNIIPTREPQLFITPVPTTLGKNAEVTIPYQETIPLNYNTVTRSFQSNKAPIHISLNTEPQMITDKKVIFNGPSDNIGTEKKITRPDENAYSHITVRDLASGGIVTEDGYAKLFSSETPKLINIMKEGHYGIDITGSKATVILSVSV